MVGIDTVMAKAAAVILAHRGVLKLGGDDRRSFLQGIVSNDVQFLNEVLANTISGTIYAGLLARTTAAPQQHWFGPSGDVRAGGIHTKEAIQLCWSGHREIIYDHGPSPKDWTPNQT